MNFSSKSDAFRIISASPGIFNQCLLAQLIARRSSKTYDLSRMALTLDSFWQAILALHCISQINSD